MRPSRADLARYCDKLSAFVNFADELGQLSTCRRRKVGTIVFPPDCSTVNAIGYNGPPRGVPNDSCTGESGKCGCAHAEANAVGKIGLLWYPSLMYVSTQPCYPCATAIVNCGGIMGVLYGESWRDDAGIRLLGRAGIPVVRVASLGERRQRDIISKWWAAGRARRGLA